MPTSISAWQSFLRKNIVSPNVWEGESETSVKDKRDYANQSAFWFYIPGGYSRNGYLLIAPSR